MMKEKILSISVAAYNIEKFIEQNLESFINSSVRDDIEVIVTDDGSKDNTVSIVKDYQKKYPNIIKLVEQKNAGPGSTVNSGIKHATGKYFRMVDGDDWVNTENLEKYIGFLKDNDVDMLVTNYIEFYNDTNQEKLIQIEKAEFNKVLEFNNIENVSDLEMHNVTFRTKIFKENSIVLDNGFYTDVEYLLLPIPYVKKVAFLDIPIYVYRLALATQSVNIFSFQKNIKMLTIVVNRLVKYYEKNKSTMSSNKNLFLKYRIFKMIKTKTRVLLTFEINKENKMKIIEFLHNLRKESSDIYNYSMNDNIVQLLVKSKYTIYRPLSIIYKQRINYFKQLKERKK